MLSTRQAFVALWARYGRTSTPAAFYHHLT